MGLSRAVFEIKGDAVENRRLFLPYPYVFNVSADGVSVSDDLYISLHLCADHS